MAGGPGDEPSAPSEVVRPRRSAIDILLELSEKRGAISPTQTTPTIDDKQNYAIQQNEFGDAGLQAQIDKADMDFRRQYAPRLFYMSIVWLGIMLLFVLFAGIGWLRWSDPVLVSLITTTTASVIGLFAIVTRYYFRAREHNGNNGAKDNGTH